MALAGKTQWILPALLWLWLGVHLQQEWSLNSQYSYGWAVPFLGALILYLRWQRAPRPVAPDKRLRAIGIIWLLLLLLLPIRLVEEANPDWRFLSWLLALDIVAVSLLWMFMAGGFPWLKHFAFPFCFPLVAVPWPVQFENSVVHTMMRGVASVAVEIAGWFGIGAYQLGNVIQLRSGFVGVDEACSGVKTLQAGIMVALVLGEFLQLRARRRFALLVLGCGWVFLCNILRATALVFVAATRGLETLGRWHDSIGTVALLGGMAGLFLLAWFWRSDLPMVDVASERSPRVPAFPKQWFALLWLGFTFAGTELWYRFHERSLLERPAWRVVLPNDGTAFRPLPIPESTRVILRYDQAMSLEWEQPPHTRWWTFFAHWKPRRAALQLVRSHSPEICLPAVGRTFRGMRTSVAVTLGDLALDFRAYEFEQNGQPLFVFVCIQEDKRAVSGRADSGEWNLRGRLVAAWQGKRNLGQRMLEIAVTGFDDFDEARSALAKTAEKIVRRGDATG
ncbi:MAG TPA: exosortase/archaeosortase family protein [Verrucomicrobiae bacterium]|nr:exosortase/archaeosortase family protein [Verrucomicrobiae bacterium]